MARWRLGTMAFVLGLLSVGLTLSVWAFIISRASSGAFHDQGGMLITFILFPLTFLGWAIAGVAAIILGRRAARRSEGGDGGRSHAIAGVILGVAGLLLSLGTCIVPEVIAQAIFR